MSRTDPSPNTAFALAGWKPKKLRSFRQFTRHGPKLADTPSAVAPSRSESSPNRSPQPPGTNARVPSGAVGVVVGVQG